MHPSAMCSDTSSCLPHADPTCKYAISYATVNGVRTTTPTFELWGINNVNGLLKMPGINLNAANAEGAVICIVFNQDPRNMCRTPSTWMVPHDGTGAWSLIQSGNCVCCSWPSRVKMMSV